MRTIFHIDMDAFFASVEELRRPELRGKAVVIGGSGDPTRRGVVSTASYEARKFGVHSAMPLRTALKLCPNCVFLPVDYEEYSRISGIIKNILHEFSPLMEDIGIDEAYLDLSGSQAPPEETALKIKKRVKEQTGLSCSIGISHNKLLAKIASDLQKPDGLTIIREEDIQRLIWPLPARKLPGVGPKMELHLKEHGISTIGDIARRDFGELKTLFGNSYGDYLSRASKGLDESPIITSWAPKSISREETYEVDTNDWQSIARTLAALLKDVVGSLKNEGYRARNVTIKIRFEDFQTLTRAKTIQEETDSLELLRRAAFECLSRLEIKKRVRLVGVRLGTLSKIVAE